MDLQDKDPKHVANSQLNTMTQTITQVEPNRIFVEGTEDKNSQDEDDLLRRMDQNPP